MKPVLLLAADLLHRAADPRFGDAVNEMAAWQFDDAARADEYLRSELLGPGLTTSDETTVEMPFASWMWLLHWRQREGAPLDEPVLDLLTREAVTGERRLQLLVLVGQDPILAEQMGSVDRDEKALGLPLRWLEDQVRNAAVARSDPFELMRHLLQISTDVTLRTLFELLRRESEYRAALRAEVFATLSTRGLDSEQLARWTARLGLRERG